MEASTRTQHIPQGVFGGWVGVDDAEAIRMSMMLVQAMFTLALEWGEASSNPVALVRKPRQGRQRAIDVMDPKLVERVRRWMLDRGDLFSATLVSVLAYSGMRPGEALALERRHVRNDTILIEQAVAGGRIKLQKTGRV
jgi:integrase